MRAKEKSVFAGRERVTRRPMERAVVIRREVEAGQREGRKLANCTSLGAVLEVGRKTVLRDIEFLRDEMDWPLEYDSSRRGYYFSRPIDDLPLFAVTEGELLALFVTQKSLGALEGTPLAERVRSAVGKLSAKLPAEVTVDWADLDSTLSFRGSPLAVPEVETFEALAVAVRGRREVAFTYRKLGAGKDEVRHVRPYHLASVQGAWYLFGYDRKRSAVRTFVLTRVGEVSVRKATFVVPEDFCVAKLLETSFGVFSAGEAREVVLEFDRFAAQLVRERAWHASQEVRELDGGRIETRFSLGGLEEVERWVLSWGRHVVVRKPEELRARVAAEACALAANHAGDDPAPCDAGDAAR